MKLGIIHNVAVSQTYLSLIVRLSLGLSVTAIPHSWASGLVRDGTTARTQAMAGASVAVAESPLEAMTSNPAAITQSKNIALEISVDGVFVRGTLKRAGEKDASLRNRINVLGDVAIAFPSGYSAVRFGLSASPSSAAVADWRYRDREGGLDGKTSFGEIGHHSRFVAYDFKAGVGIDFSRWFSAGIAAGVVYNQNALDTAYIFQNQPVLRGFKTRLDLDTEGYGFIGQVGLTLQPTSTLKISATYTIPTTIDSKGDAAADMSSQLQSLGGVFASVEPGLQADAEVQVKLPQKVALAVAWQATDKFLVTTELEWVNWADAFDVLPVTLKNSSNNVVNSLVGTNQFTDNIPLGWRDQKILRIGGEYRLDPAWSLRAGYSYSTRVIPSELLTPLSAAIDDSIVSAGIGYQQPGWHLDLAWQWHLPATEKIATSALKSGEYSNSSVRIESHWIGLTYGVEF